MKLYYQLNIFCSCQFEYYMSLFVLSKLPYVILLDIMEKALFKTILIRNKILYAL